MKTRENKKNNNNAQVYIHTHTHSTKEKSKSRRYGTKYVFIQMLNSMKPVVSYERHSQIKVTMWKGGDIVCERRERSIVDPNDRKKKKKKNTPYTSTSQACQVQTAPPVDRGK